jgi:hypothetical protein
MMAALGKIWPKTLGDFVKLNYTIGPSAEARGKAKRLAAECSCGDRDRGNKQLW